jgi:hypothetical protein
MKQEEYNDNDWDDDGDNWLLELSHKFDEEEDDVDDDDTWSLCWYRVGVRWSACRKHGKF